MNINDKKVKRTVDRLLLNIIDGMDVCDIGKIEFKYNQSKKIAIVYDICGKRAIRHWIVKKITHKQSRKVDKKTDI